MGNSMKCTPIKRRERPEPGHNKHIASWGQAERQRAYTFPEGGGMLEECDRRLKCLWRQLEEEAEHVGPN
jgi:hypothetical protein